MSSLNVDDAVAVPDKLSSSAIASEEKPIDDGTCLFVDTTTWTRDSHELFDYEARHVHKGSFYLRTAARIFRTVLSIQIITDEEQLPSQTADYLLAIRYVDSHYMVVPADRNIQATPTAQISPKKIWLVVKDLPNHCHNLKEGDVMKLGRFKVRIKQLATEGDTTQDLKLDDHEIPHSAVDPEEVVLMQCRICLLDGGTGNDPLVCPCNCKGSIKYVHLDCLRHWINGRLLLTEEDQSRKVAFFFKQLHCELCKSPFPSAIILNNEKIPIVRVPKIEAPFIVLENNVGSANRGLHVISMDVRKELKLGRGHESDVRIADVSISRHHATIRLLDGEFVLEDHNSKFGTLVSSRKILPVLSSNTLAIQVGRTLLNLSLKKPPCGFDDVLLVNEDGTVSNSQNHEFFKSPNCQHQQHLESVEEGDDMNVNSQSLQNSSHMSSRLHANSSITMSKSYSN